MMITVWALTMTNFERKKKETKQNWQSHILSILMFLTVGHRELCCYVFADIFF